MKRSVNERIKALRLALKLNQSDFANEIGVSASLVSTIERGETPSQGTIDLIVETYSVKESWLLTGAGEMTFERKKVSSDAPWKDEAFKHLKDEVTFYRNLLTQMAGGKGNFLQALNVTAQKRKLKYAS